MKYGFLLLVLLITACAYSPQQIKIEPKVVIAGEAFGNGRVVDVVVEDKRSNKVIGSRGGAYPETSVITVANNFNQAIVVAAQGALQQQGFAIDAEQASAAVVKVIIDSLDYENDKEAVTAKVDLKVVLELQVTVAEKTYSGRYKSASSQQLVISPSAEKNEKLINGVLAETLQRAFSDPKVKAFLSNS